MTKPDPDVLRLAAVDRELASLVASMEAARTQYVQATQLWYVKRAERDKLAAYIAARMTGAVPAPVSTSASGPTSAGPEAQPRSDVSHNAVQNLLFVIGGVLVVIAAIAFRVFAWASIGPAGRALILATVTAGMLCVPLLARRRGLRATAETFAAVGIALLLVDGLGAHGMDLFGLGRFDLMRFSGALFGFTAVIATGYAIGTKLRSPRFVALVAYLPVFLLLLGSAGAPARLSLVLSATAAGLLVIVLATRRDRAIAMTAIVLAGVFLFLATLSAADVNRPLAPAALAAVAVLTLAATYQASVVQASRTWPRNVGGVIATIEIAVAAAAAVHRYVGTPVLLAYPAMAVVVAIVVISIPPRLCPPRALRAGALVYSGAAALAAVFVLLIALSVYAIRVTPIWHTALANFDADTQKVSWTLPVGLGTAAIALAVLVSRRMAAIPLTAGVVAVVVSLPSALPLRWWAPPVLDGIALLALVLVIAFAPDRVVRICATAASGLIGLHALLASLIRPSATAAALAGFTALGVVHAAIGARRGRLSQIIGGTGLAVAFLSMPGAVAACASLTQPTTVVLRLAASTVVVDLIITIAVGRWWQAYRWYASAAVTFTAVTVGVLAPYVGTHDPAVLYATGAMLVSALAPACVRVTGWQAMLTASAGALLVPAAAVRVLPAGATVLFLPYTWVAHVWSGAPSGVGLAPAHPWHVGYVDAIALALGTLAVVALGPIRRATPLPAVTTILVALAAAGAGWPSVPLVSLVLGAAATLAAALHRPPAWSRTFGQRANLAMTGTLAIGAGIAGLLPTKPSTLAALGFCVVTLAVVGVTGRHVGVRAFGWVGAVLAATTLSFAAVRATGVATSGAAFGVLGASACALLVSAWLFQLGDEPPVTDSGRIKSWRVESDAVAAAAHAGALVAIIMAGGASRSALACAIWGVVLGARALWPGFAESPRFVYTSIAIGLEVVAWWILLGVDARPVDVYTLPMAGALLVIGWLAVRRRPEVRSWVAYGPALVAAFLPSSVPLLGPDVSVTRRLMVGAAALVVLIAGALTRLQAPTVVGAATVLLVAMHELVLLWQLIPSWIPLSIAALLVLAIAITYERRRRDVGRLRSYVGRMS